MILFVLAPAADAATVQPQAKDADPVVCQQQVRTNRRFTRKVRLCKSEADTRAKADRRAAEEVVSRPSINPPSNGG